MDGIDYSSVYDYNFYVEKYPDIWKAFGLDDTNVLKHFVLYGMKEGRQGNEKFDVNSYMKEYADLRIAFKNDKKRYYIHYINYGSKEGRKATGTTVVKNPIKIYDGVDYSAVYDYCYYTSKNPDVKKAFGEDDITTLLHFIKYGMNERRSSISTFDITSYAYANVDFRRAFKDDFKIYYLHYMQYGKKEGRKATGCKTLQNYETIYGYVDYVSVYDFNYYWTHNAKVQKVAVYDDLKVLEYFAKNDLTNDVMAINWIGKKSEYLQMKKNLIVDPLASLREQIVQYALQFEGCKYVHGGMSPAGFDCSGFTAYVYKHFGYTISKASAV